MSVIEMIFQLILIPTVAILVGLLPWPWSLICMPLVLFPIVFSWLIWQDMLFPKIWKDKLRRTHFESLCKSHMFLLGSPESMVKENSKTWLIKRKEYVGIGVMSETIKLISNRQALDEVIQLADEVLGKWRTQDRKANNNVVFDSVIWNMLILADQGSDSFSRQLINIINREWWDNKYNWKRATIKCLDSNNINMLENTVNNISWMCSDKGVDDNIRARLKEIYESKEKHHQSLKRYIYSILETLKSETWPKDMGIIIEEESQ